jgi:co-chaperonin GroES (HSP10)
MTKIPLGPNLIIRCDVSEKKSSGGIIIAAEGTRDAQAPEEGIVESLGEHAFDDLDVKPIIGDRVVIARYDGKVVEDRKDLGYELRLIADTRILAIVK